MGDYLEHGDIYIGYLKGPIEPVGDTNNICVEYDCNQCQIEVEQKDINDLICMTLQKAAMNRN